MELEYKYVVRSEGDMSAVRWKEGGNFMLQLPSQGRLRVKDTWDESAREVEVSQWQQRDNSRSRQAGRQAGMTCSKPLHDQVVQSGSHQFGQRSPQLAEESTIQHVAFCTRLLL